MKREDIADIVAFVAVAEEKSFTRAAVRLGVSQSALSQIVSRLEDRLGVRLLSRTTRSVTATEAGKQLALRMSPLIEGLEEGLAEINSLRTEPRGMIRITTVEHAAKTIIAPALEKLIAQYPELTVEVIVDYNLIDVVSEGFDAGVRLGDQVEKDMIAMRIGADIPMAIVATAEYFAKNPVPLVPEDVVTHHCICLRLPTSKSLYAWRFIKNGRELRVRVAGPLILNTTEMMIETAKRGLGLACLPRDLVEQDIQNGDLVAVLEDSVAPLPGYHLYYPNRRNSSLAFRLFLDALRYQSD